MPFLHDYPYRMINVLCLYSLSCTEVLRHNAGLDAWSCTVMCNVENDMRYATVDSEDILQAMALYNIIDSEFKNGPG